MPILTLPGTAILSFLLALTLSVFTEEKRASLLQKDKEALAPLQQLVGQWRGAGFMRRGSTRGAWKENASWSWKFSEGRAAMVFDAPKGRHLKKGRLSPGKTPGIYELKAELADKGQAALYAGRKDKDGKLVLEAKKPPPDGAPAKISLSILVGGKRLAVLFEGRNRDSGRHYRLGEVGYTRSGESISKGTGQPECIVTGGRGTIPVEHKGDSYTVCCRGCLDAFNENPEQILAEWRDRVKSELEKKKARRKPSPND